MLAKRTSVEFAHIYGNEFPGASQRHSVGLANELIKSVGRESVHTVVMIDDYNPDVVTLNTDEYARWLDDCGALPDLLALEADIACFAAEVRGRMDDRRTQRSLERYERSRGRHPCSLLTATWYLMRLGLFPHEGLPPCSQIMNVLSRKHKATEEAALEILSDLGVDLNAIEVIYF